MKLLVIGNGGREHALAWKLAASPKVTHLYVAPGNAGTEHAPKIINLPITNQQELLDWAIENHIDLTVVGPEAPLAQGIVDLFRTQGQRIFGPTQAAAQLESSKAFAKSFMARHNIPTAHYAVFTDATKAHEYVTQWGAPIVIKADGLAAGKGVVVAMTLEEAHHAIDTMLPTTEAMIESSSATSRVVIEAFLQGEEASFMVLCDGETALPLVTSQDHKRLLDGDQGPNTGGMGAYSPAPVVTNKVYHHVMETIIHPTLAAMRQEGVVFTGFLYAGLMIEPDGNVKTLEFNCRMGDPETQPILMRLKSDLADILLKATEQQLHTCTLEWDDRMALGVVLAAANYPHPPPQR